MSCWYLKGEQRKTEMQSVKLYHFERNACNERHCAIDATSGVVNLRQVMFTEARDLNFGLNLPLLSFNSNRESSGDHVCLRRLVCAFTVMRKPLITSVNPLGPHVYTYMYNAALKMKLCSS